MQYRTIGKTGLRVSEIGFGCGNNAVLMVKAPHEDQVKAVRHALDAGINFFDTAFAYGLGKSEENLGRILHELGAQPVISTKIRLESEAVGDVKAATIRAVEAGLARLGRDRVDFVQLQRCMSSSIAASFMGFSATTICSIRAPATLYLRHSARRTTGKSSIVLQGKEWELLLFAFWPRERSLRIRAPGAAAAAKRSRRDQITPRTGSALKK